MTLPAQDIVERLWPESPNAVGDPHASVNHKMIRDGNGGYVRFSKYEALCAYNEALRKALERIEMGYGPDHLSEFCRDVASAALANEEAGR